MITIEDLGRSHAHTMIESLEGSYPGMCPMFYHTGSYMGDLAEANRYREIIGEPRPQEVIDRHEKMQREFQEAVEAENAAFIERVERENNRWWRRLLKKAGFNV